MNKARNLAAGRIGFVLCAALLGALTGYVSYAQPSVLVGVSVGLPSVQIRAESDFYQPLTSYGAVGGSRSLRTLLSAWLSRG